MFSFIFTQKNAFSFSLPYFIENRVVAKKHQAKWKIQSTTCNIYTVTFFPFLFLFCIFIIRVLRIQATELLN